jgi:glucose/mannose-6-phosphate isomerase
MKQIILDFPKQFRIGFEAASNLKIKGKFKGVCICGMGGSALPGNLLSLWLNEKKIDLPLILQRDYTLPHQVKKNWLVICISYSGNTEETLSCFRAAKNKNLKIAVITSNGKLENLAKKYKIPCVLIPKGIPPRMALGYQFAGLIGILNKAGLVKLGIKEILELEKGLKPKKHELEGKRLAKILVGKIPLIYSSNRLKTIARIWKIKFNENSKIPAFWNYFPELNHNEMVGFEKVKSQKSKVKITIQNSKFNFYFIILKDQSDHPKIKRRMDLTAKILKKRGLKGEIINIQGKDFLEKVFSAIILSDWASYYLALHYKIDPIPVKIVEEFKKKMQG